MILSRRHKISLRGYKIIQGKINKTIFGWLFCKTLDTLTSWAIERPLNETIQDCKITLWFTWEKTDLNLLDNDQGFKGNRVD